MINRLNRILKIIKASGPKRTLELIIIKIENIAVGILSPLFIFLARYSNFNKLRRNNNVLILLEQRYSVSALNRAYDLAEYLRMNNYKVHISSPINSVFKILLIDKFPVIVFQRNVSNRIINSYLQLAHAKRIKKIYDCDDLLFDPEMILNLKEDVDSAKNRLLKIAEKHFDVYSKCEYFMTTTNYLAEHSIKRHPDKNVFILRNGLNKLYIEICDQIINKAVKPEDKIIIGYMSGTASHNADFKLIENTLFEIMKNHKNVYLKVIGLLNIPDYFYSLGKRIIKVPLVDFYKLPAVISDFTINIAPSVIGNPFNEGKSELKYIYAGYLGIPTVASATDAFRTAIENNKNGILCSTENDWYTAFEKLISEHETRKMIGLNAKKQIENVYIPGKMKTRANEIFTNIING